ncbi:hypothetical protein [Silvanigrella sp.]|jgi:hypothetical protein|uniref:hypothetical protein n=1 Tax=Silvanigrella sp. TaxID=2024976 RepID=UPI0037C7B9BB|nr:hypothetical protein [Silvanigrellaceae bacterium]
MEVKVLFFAKILLNNGNSSIFFALKNKELPCLSIYNNSIIDFVQKYNLKRHEEFDSIVNKNFSLRYLIEWQTHLKDSLPNQILFNNENISLNWMLFPQAVKLLSNGKEKNFLQLAVQYISNGGIDQNVIAADYDEAFIKVLQKKLDS